MKKSKSLRTLNAQIKYLNNRFKYHKSKDLIIDSIDLNKFQGLEDLSNFILKPKENTEVFSFCDEFVNYLTK